MASLLWHSYAARPFGLAGAASLLAWVEGGNDPVLEVRAVVALSPTADPDDPAAVRVGIPLGKNATAFVQDLPPSECSVCFFARRAGGWEAGPVVQVDFSPTWSAEFAYLKEWATTTMQRLESERQPLGADRTVQVRSSFPRDTFPMPCISIQFSAVPQAQTMLGNFAGAPAAQLAQERTPWAMSLSVVLWSETPEERDAIAPWFLQAMTALGSLAPFVGLAEPAFEFSESEDFSGELMEKPLFLITCSLSGTVWSELKVASHNYKGHMTV